MRGLALPSMIGAVVIGWACTASAWDFSIPMQYEARCAVSSEPDVGSFLDVWAWAASGDWTWGTGLTAPYDPKTTTWRDCIRLTRQLCLETGPQFELPIAAEFRLIGLGVFSGQSAYVPCHRLVPASAIFVKP